MPAKSKSQQRLFGMALAVRKGEMNRGDVWKEVLEIVDSDMTDKEIEDFASTKHKGLKEQFENMKDIKEYVNESRRSIPGQDVIELNAIGNYGYMYWDPNMELVGTYCMRNWKDLVDEFLEDEKWAKELQDLDVGETLEHPSGSIYCRIW